MARQPTVICFDKGNEGLIVNFILVEMTFLRYYIPLIAEGNKRGIKSKVFVGPSHKYNCPLRFKGVLLELSREYNFEIIEASKAKEYNGYFFLIEATAIDLLNPNQKKVSLSYTTTFSYHAHTYRDKVDYIVYPSEFMVDFYNLKRTEKDLCLGVPKYDIVLNKEEINKKYDLTDNKKALFIAPKLRDLNKIDLSRIYKIFKNEGYDILVKTRGKDPIPNNLRGDRYFTDNSWHPHTSMELMEASNIVVNFSSSVIKEIVMLRRPVVNFDIKPFKMCLPFLYDYDYCRNLKKDANEQQIKNAIKELTTRPLDDIFDLSIKSHLFSGNSSKRILDRLGL
jgi:hypothetical protein